MSKVLTTFRIELNEVDSELSSSSYGSLGSCLAQAQAMRLTSFRGRNLNVEQVTKNDINIPEQ